MEEKAERCTGQKWLSVQLSRFTKGANDLKSNDQEYQVAKLCLCVKNLFIFSIFCTYHLYITEFSTFINPLKFLSKRMMKLSLQLLLSQLH